MDTDRARRRGPSAAAALLLLAVLAAAPALGQNATGEPTISGVHRVGEELTAATDAIADPDGIIGATFAYRWIRVDASSVETDIASATSSTYTLAGADEGGQVKVRASFTDDAGNPEARTSAAFPASGSVLESCALPPYHPSFGVELLAATMTVGDYFGTFYGYDSGGNLDNYGDLSQKTFDRPDGEPADYRAEPTRERTVITIYNYPGTGVYFAFEPGWTPPVNPSPGKTVLWVCDEVYAFFGSNEVTITEDYFQVGASVRDEDWSMLANPEVRIYYDDAAPEFASAAVEDSSLEITFSEPVRSFNSAVQLAAFSVYVNGSRTTHSPRSVSVDGGTVRLTLASSAVGSDTVEVAYANLSAEPIKDGSFNTLESFSRQPVRVVAGPLLQSAALAPDGTALTLTFNEPLDATSVPAAAAFRVKVNGAPVALATTNPVSVAGRTVVLKLARRVGVGERVAVSYAKERAAPAEGGQ